MSPTTEAAIDAIGREGPRDWVLEPETHAAALPPSAAALKRVLTSPELTHLIQDFSEKDRHAGEAQRVYKRLAKTSAVASFLSVLIASTLLLPPLTGVPPILITMMAGIQGVLLVVSYVASFVLMYRKPFARWMHLRAEAETFRIALFDKILAAEHKEPPRPEELPLLPLQLEYFRRHQFDVQRLYYAKRGSQHAAAVRRAGLWRLAGLILVGLAAVPLALNLIDRSALPDVIERAFAFIPSRLELAQRLFLCFGLIGGALQGLLASVLLMSQDERNSVRYLDTARNLEDLATRPLAEAREAASAGDRAQVLAFAALLHQEISSEHREWIALRSMVPDLSLRQLRAMRLPKVV